MPPVDERLLLEGVRLGLAAAVLFALLPPLLFPGAPSHGAGPDDAYEIRCRGLVLAGTLYLGLVHLLAAVGVFDPVIFLVCVAGLTLVRLGSVSRGDRARRRYARLLRFLETEKPVARLRGAARDRLAVPGPARPSLAALVALLVATLAVRGGVVWGSSDLLSLSAYDLLADVKFLRGGELFPGGVLEERGLHAMVLTLHALSQVDPAAIVRLTGLLTVLLLGYVIYEVTRAAAQSQAAGAAAAALFAVAGVAWSPFGSRLATEPDPVPLAAAFLLPALAFAARYVFEGRRPHLVLAVCGLVSATLVSASTGLLGAGVLAAGAATWGLVAPGTEGRARAAAAFGVGAGLLLLLGVGELTGPHVVRAVDPYHVPHFDVVANTLAPAGPSTVPTALIGACLAASALLLGLSRLDPTGPTRGGALAFGTATAVLAGLSSLGATARPVGVEPGTATFLLGVVLCVAGGLLLAVGLRWLMRTVPGSVSRGRLVAGSMAATCGVVAGSAWLALSASPAPPEPLQPDGYGRAYEMARRLATPDDWTVVGHEGLRVRVRDDGYHMGYEAFLAGFDLEAHLRPEPRRRTTRDFFVFVDRRPAEALVRSELRPPTPETTRRLQSRLDRWVERSEQVEVIYEDAALRAYRIRGEPQVGSPPALAGLR